MKIGITERGDASRDFSWKDQLKYVDGAILITKNITNEFIKEVLEVNQTKPLIVHCTCTGWGDTILEPNVPTPSEQLVQLRKLIDLGFSAKNCVLRLDPIFPSRQGIMTARSVLNKFLYLVEGVTRVRVSIVDEYRHIKIRYRNNGISPLYGNSFGPDYFQRASVARLLEEFPRFTFETCAEDGLAEWTKNAESLGCISKRDLDIMGLTLDDSLTENPQKRHGCHCLSCKSELLANRHRCENGCLYCYWKD